LKIKDKKNVDSSENVENDEDKEFELLNVETALTKFEKLLTNKWVKAAIFIFIVWFFYYLGSISCAGKFCVSAAINASSETILPAFNFTMN
jgi:hypothetical protein